MQQKGYGGQAREMRGEPNSIGIPTKWAPDSNKSSYFCDGDLDNTTGLSQLARRAPRIYKYITDFLTQLVTKDPGRNSYRCP